MIYKFVNIYIFIFTSILSSASIFPVHKTCVICLSDGIYESINLLLVSFSSSEASGSKHILPLIHVYNLNNNNNNNYKIINNNIKRDIFD